MSRFKRSPGAVAPPVQDYPPAVPAQLEPVAPVPENEPLEAAEAERQSAPVEPPPHATAIESAGFAVLCAYLLAGALTDVFGRYLGKLYLSAGALILLPIVWFVSQNRFRFFHHKVGRYMAFFLLWMIVDIPFSTYRHGSFDMLREYIPRSFAILIYISAFTVDFRKCRTLMFVTIGASFLELLTCVKFGGYSEDGRYRVVDTIFASNANELAMQLLLAIVYLVFLFYGRGVFKKVFAAGAIGVAAMYMVKTGSRGCFLAALCYALAMILLSRHKVLALGIAILCTTVALATVPAAALGRLKLLIESSDDPSSASADGSRLERQELLKRSVVETVKHPVFGVGPDCFADAVAGEQEKRGEHANWLGTHNSYTQVSAECGIPALVFYTGALLMCFGINYRLLKLARSNPAYKQYEGFAVTLFCSALVYAVCTFFFHMAYSGVLPALTGMTIVVYMASRQQLQAAAPVAVPKAW